MNGLAAADDVIVPIQCEYYALEGLGQLLRNVALVRANLNPTLDVRGIVLTMYDARTKLAEQVEHEVREHFGEQGVQDGRAPDGPPRPRRRRSGSRSSCSTRRRGAPWRTGSWRRR